MKQKPPPNGIRKELDLNLGDDVSIEYMPGGQSVILSKKDQHDATFVTVDFMKIAEKVNKQYGKALSKQAKR